MQRALNRHTGFNLMQWMGLQAHLTLTGLCTLRDCIVLTRAVITICSSCTLWIGRWRNEISAVYALSLTLRGSLPVTDWAAQEKLALTICISSSCHDGNLFTRTILRYRFFGGPNIQVSQNTVKSGLGAFWIYACWRKCHRPVSGSCWSSAELLSRTWLLR
jgi:hypothetical protein